MYPPYPLPSLPPGLLEHRLLSERAAERYAQTEHLRAARRPPLRGARIRLARWIAPAGLEPVV